MSGWTRKRFWSEVAVVTEEDGFGIRLDDRPVRTPAKSGLLLPTQALAEAVAAEWSAQAETVDPATMPMTRMANSAIDKVRPQFDEVVRHLAAYGETDLLCYRAEAPAELVQRQADAWDPWIDWLGTRHDVRLRTVSGVLPVAQDPQAIRRLEVMLGAFSPHELAAMHDLVALPGSLVLALAVASGDAQPSDIWDCARVDELWQIEQWGADDEAERVNDLKRSDFLNAARFFNCAAVLR